MENQTPISAEKLQKYHGFLNSVNESTTKGVIRWSEIDSIRKNCKISSNAFKSAVALGFFSKKKHGLYASRYVGRFEPKHAREVIEKEIYLYPYLKQKSTKTKKIVPIVIDKPKQTVKHELKPRKKTVSLFWGLFTYSY